MTAGLDRTAVRAGLRALFLAAPPEETEVAALAGDASTRRYYRVRFPAGTPFPTVVLMLYPDAVPPDGELPFLNVRRYLAAAGIPVPAVYRHDPASKLLFLEDAGDTMLEDAVRERGARGCLSLYEQCVEILVRIQSQGTNALDGNAIPRRLRFDAAKFSEEIDFFFRHAVRGFGGIPLSDAEERSIEDLFLPVLERLAALPTVLTHRDFHSRNVMVLSPAKARGDANLRVLDFQDARMGNVFYDLASLLRDSYVTLPGDMEDHLRYVWRHAATRDLRNAASDPGAFEELLDLSSLQRNVKAIGTFGNQARNRGKTFYLRFIPPTVAHLRRNFDRNPSLRPLAERLLPVLSALEEKASAEVDRCGR